MQWTELHARMLKRAFERVLGNPTDGSVAFVRCLTPDVIFALASDPRFAPVGWRVWRVADFNDAASRTISADRAVEMRETKSDAFVLLVDTTKAGAGMDGVYSAAREVDEASLFGDALRFAKSELTSQMSRKHRDYAERAVKKARGGGRRFSVSLWTEFDFICQIAAQRKHPGIFFYLLGMWPVLESGSDIDAADVDVSRIFVDRLLGAQVSGLMPTRRIEALRLLNPSDQQIRDLEGFLRTAATKSLLPALAELADKPDLWVNALRVEGAAEVIQGVELSSWRTNTGRIAKWSGLVEESDSDEPPILILNPDADKTGDYSKLEVRWKSRPEHLEKGSVEYRISILTEMDEEITSKEISHSGSREEKCRFSNDDFTAISEDALISAKVVLSVVGNDLVKRCESEEFVVRFGQPPELEHGGVGKKIRTFSEGVIELDSLDAVCALSLSVGSLPTDSKGFILLRTPQRGKSFRVFRPPLIDEIERQWAERAGAIGRWRVRVRSSGARAAQPEFVPLEKGASVSQALWDRVTTANRRMSERFTTWGGGVGQIYNQRSKDFDSVVKEYLLAWTAIVDEADPLLALANTVEVQSLSGRTIGLIVPPAHPLRVAWHVAYDNLVFHAVFEEKMGAKEVRDEFLTLDGAMFPAFLPSVEGESCFVFADTLGFHSVGMVLDSDKEPKASVAILARALGESETADTAPTVGQQSATILGNEIIKYMECHNTSRLLHIHALRPGDGLTVARSLGRVYEHYRKGSDDDELDEPHSRSGPAFVLELYPSEGQRGIAGRFIAEAREKRRSGAGVLSADDQWMLESLSLSGGVNLPRLRWARKSEPDPRSAAHLAIAFDTFESRVVADEKTHKPKSGPLYAFGLLSFFERDYLSTPSPIWRNGIVPTSDGEKHPADRAHTERLVRLQQAVQRSVARSIQAEGEIPILRTVISPEKAQSLCDLHRLCDWVITLDRNAGVEYFDSPKDNRDVYDAYVIDCVPERQDLGCLQLITSTSNLEEVRNLLDGALDQMGLSRSRRNAEFLMEHLKALTGRLAIRLTGEKAPTSELIALALTHANCGRHSQGSGCWMALDAGFIIPVDDVRDLLPHLKEQEVDRDEGHSRPDLIYVSVVPRKGLLFQFVEVKYRRHLSAARNSEVLQDIRRQVESLRKRWEDWYCRDIGCSSSRAIRRAKLARMLRFYADKARRHYLPEEQYNVITTEIDRMIEKAGDYSFSGVQRPDRGWIFCPEYAGDRPLEVSSTDWETRVFLFGPTMLPDSEFRKADDTDESLIGNGSSAEDDSRGEASPGEDGSLQSAVVVADHPPIDGTVSTVDAAKHQDSGTPSLRLGADVLTDSDVCWSLTIKGNPHLLIAGLPGMGKTTCLLNLCSQMLSEGVRPIVFSYHPDFDERLQLLVPSVRFVDFHGLGFNPLQVLNRESAMAYLDVAGALRDIFVAIFPELGDIQAERVRKAIKDSFIEAGWDVAGSSLAGLREPPFRRFVEILRNDPKPDRGLLTLLARLDELGDYGFFAEGESQESLWDSDQPIVIRIHTTQNDNLQRAFASVVFYGLYKDMFRRGIKTRITHALVFDEAHRAAGLKLIPTMAKECRKFGISLVVASQEAKDFNISLFSAIANYLVLRLTEVDAKALVRNVASSQQERLLIDKIKQMDRFKALYFCEGKSRPSLVSLLP